MRVPTRGIRSNVYGVTELRPRPAVAPRACMAAGPPASRACIQVQLLPALEIISDRPRSASAIVGAFVFALTMFGMTAASMTRSP